jgi:hypothetical protein
MEKWLSGTGMNPKETEWWRTERNSESKERKGVEQNRKEKGGKRAETEEADHENGSQSEDKATSGGGNA